MGRNIALLFPGQSLIHYWDNSLLETYRCVIAVNFASHLFESDYVAFYDNDLGLLVDGMIEPNVGYITKPGFKERTDKEVLTSPFHGIRKTVFIKKGDPEDKYCSNVPKYTGTLAWGQAISMLGYTEEIHCYGLDLLPEDDCCGLGGTMRDNARCLSEIIWMRHLNGERAVIISDAHTEVKRYIATGKGFDGVLELYD